jgi:methyl-accepting chemotaxis protein
MRNNSYVSLTAVFLVVCGSVAGWSGYQYLNGVQADSFYASETAELKSAAIQALYISGRAATDSTYTAELVALQGQVNRSIDRLRSGDGIRGIPGLPESAANALASFQETWNGITPSIDKIGGSKGNTEVFTRNVQETARSASTTLAFAQDAQRALADHKGLTPTAQNQLQAAFNDLNEAVSLITREGSATTDNLHAAESAISLYLGAMTAVGNTLPRDNTILDPLLKSYRAAQDTQRALSRAIKVSSNAVENQPHAGVIWQMRDRLLATTNALSSSVASLPDARAVSPLIVAVSGLLTILLALVSFTVVLRSAASREKSVEEEGSTIQESQRTRSQDLKIFLNELAQVKNGNLNAPMTDDRDSTKEIARELNSTFLNIRGIFEDAHNTIVGLSAASEQTLMTARNVDRNRTEQFNALSEIRDLFERTLSFIETIQGMMIQTLEVSVEVALKVRSGSDSVIAVHEGISVLNQHNTGIQHQSKSLIEAFQHMSRIAEVVDTVASKAELVAFNAYLVAEQSDDAEVSRRINKSAEAMETLSRESTEAVAEINQLLKTVTEAARDTQFVVDNSQREIESLITRSNAAQESLAGIIVMTETLKAGVSEVSVKTQALKDQSGEVAETMSSIHHYATENSAASEQTASAISHVARQAQELREVIDHFIQA